MRYLRMLSNSTLGGLLGSAYLAILVLHLNPHLSLTPATSGSIYLMLCLAYGVHLAVLFYALIVLKQIIAVEVLSPGWLSLRLLSWIGAACAASAAALMWSNASVFRLTLEAGQVSRMEAGAVAIAVCAAGLIAIAIRHSFGRRGTRVAHALFVAIVMASLVVPLWLRGPDRSEPERPAGRPIPLAGSVAVPGPRVHLLLVDGASLDYLSPAAAAGWLPHFGRLLDAGASMHLTTVRPTQAATVWSAVATGKHPFRNGVRSDATYRLPGGSAPVALLPDHALSQALVRMGFAAPTPVAADALRAKPFWQILSEQGISVGVVDWPLTFPASPVRGYLVSGRFHASVAQPFTMDEEPVVYPPDALPVVRAAAAGAVAGARRGEIVRTRTADAPPASIEGPPLLRDHVNARIATDLEQRFPTRVTARRYEGIDAAGHVFLRYAQPRAFGDVSDQEVLRYGHVLDRHYGFIDAEIGEAVARLEGDDLLLVVSGYGMDPVGPLQRLAARALGDPDLTGTHERGPDGFLLAFGAQVAPGRLPVASIVDVLPTVLYYLGLPVARDMDGYARPDLFRRTFTTERPITFIPTYER